MRKTFILLFLFLSTIFTIQAKQNFYNHKDSLWHDVIEAIIYVESQGNENAVSSDGKCVGVLQIQKCLVDDCNQYLKLIKSKKRFTYDDRYNREKSIEMFYIVQKRYNKINDIEKGIRIWNGGPNGHKRKATLNYYNLVIKRLETVN